MRNNYVEILNNCRNLSATQVAVADFRDSFLEAVDLLKTDVGAHLFVIEGGDDASFAQDTEITNAENLIRVSQWHGTDSEILGPIADAICKLAPVVPSQDFTWPTRRTTIPSSVNVRSCNQIDYKVRIIFKFLRYSHDPPPHYKSQTTMADVIIMLDSSENYSLEEFNEMKESVAELVDAGFDLSPDVVRIGFVIYSDKVAVPVALGHYEDKIDLIQQISDTNKMDDGMAIALYGLNAARQQFQLHGRENATRIVIMLTNGRNRGNAAPAAEDLRYTYGVQLFIIAVNADDEGLSTLKRIAGVEYPDRVYTVATAFELDEQTATISKHLCGYTNPDVDFRPTESAFHRTTKRDVVSSGLASHLSNKARLHKFPALCSDGIKRPYQINILIDVTARSSPKDFRLVMDHISMFFQKRFAPDDSMLLLNLMTVNSQKVLDARAGLSVGDIVGDVESAKLGVGIDSLVEMSNDNYIKGSYKIMLVVSADSTSSDSAIPSAEYAAADFNNNIIGLSIRKPSTNLLTNMAGTGTRVIHLDWTSPNELFNSWFAYAICDYVTANTLKVTTKTKTMLTPSAVGLSVPTNVEAIPLSPFAFSVSWTCCTNNKSNYTILYTHDPSIPIAHWPRRSATCRDSFGTVIQNLPTDHDYTVCVAASNAMSNISAIFPGNENCTRVTLNTNTTVPDIYQPVEIAPCNCMCYHGKAVLRPSCDYSIDEYRPLTTLPPATEDECPCKIDAHAGRCPPGYLFTQGRCYDVDECATNNGGCSHGCVNTPGGHYCACPYGMTRDPLDTNTCVNAANSNVNHENSRFDRIAQLLAQYLHANVKQQADVMDTAAVQQHQKINYKATIKSADDKTITFEWASVPAMVRRAFRWLF
ncbi:von Willebrand factor type A domain protein [Dictyocaulus viviparus]|uniref:von Willebrand factor type A domain protein n=1 Tax=Dictyocaulus viviparus TaxID=29172 RepID=A0A0D8XYX7_DICVI|nr:von Willebrand factor type A domain protein [Dictyocaulus viviparus]